MNPSKVPITGRDDVKQLVDSFYEKVKCDQLIGPIFNDIARVDWNEHLPKLYNFWEDLLFGIDNYNGRPFPPHMKLDLKPEHFDRWLGLFCETVDEKFTGFKAEEIKTRAHRIAKNFAINLNLPSTPRVT